ncbi:MAG: arsenic efflux protein, partial [Kiritimatiellae bacterium]|nr:arsenic efflux protein [Kiritimatiellia bacterium]
ERFLERSRSIGPLAGGLLGAVPQCGVSAMTASFYAGGVVSVGTLLAVFLSTSDELIPVLISSRIPASIIVKIVLMKIIAAVAVGFAVGGIVYLIRQKNRAVNIEGLCRHSHCHCHKGKGIVLPALIHTAEIFVFILAVSLALHFCMEYFSSGHCCHDHCAHGPFESWRLNTPVIGELLGGLVGLIPNCAASVASARLYSEGVMSSGAMMASSFTGCGVGLLVLFRTNRNVAENIFILISVYGCGVVLGWLSGFLLDIPEF